MKKYYKFGELILAIRKEYTEYKQLLDELKSCISVKSENKNFDFSGLLSSDDNKEDNTDRRIRLHVEKKYLEILKLIQYLKYKWYSQSLYSAYFTVEKKQNGTYELEYVDIQSPVEDKKYIPTVDIIDQEKFSELIDKLLSTDVMQLKEGVFSNNHDRILLNFDEALISTPLGDNSTLTWDGVRDELKYSISKHGSPSLINNILSLEIPADKISEDWLRLLEKHESELEDVSFDVDLNAKSKRGVLQISDVEKKGNKSVVKVMKKNS